jgi:hypothetical protein
MMKRTRYARRLSQRSEGDARWELEQQSRGRSTEARVVMRNRIVLLAN